MNRSDFVERGELKVDFLKYYRLVSRWACKENDISISDLEAREHIYGMPYSEWKEKYQK